MGDDFWKYLFAMCRALYAPMHVLRLADQKTPAMDKLYFFVLQTDRMLPLWLGDAEEKEKTLLSGDVLACMSGNSMPAGSEEEEDLSDDDDGLGDDDGDITSEHEQNGMEVYDDHDDNSDGDDNNNQG